MSVSVSRFVVWNSLAKKCLHAASGKLFVGVRGFSSFVTLRMKSWLLFTEEQGFGRQSHDGPRTERRQAAVPAPSARGRAKSVGSVVG